MIHYSMSKLQHGNRALCVHSTYVHHDQFPSYIVRVILMFRGRVVYARDRGSFSRIDKAEAFHQDQVLKFVAKGYDILNSSCK